MNTLEYIVKKYNLTVGRQYIINIPNMDRDDLATLFAELNFKVGAEIGVERGLFSEILCKSNPKLYLYSIDPWKANAYEPGVHGVEAEQKNYDVRYRETKKKLAQYNCEIIRETSLSAVKNFSDESLDFVYIDGNHDFVNVTNDIHIWSKKIRPGGIVSGHDYAYFPIRKHNHVKYVVQAYTRSYGVFPYFIAGDEAMGVPGVKRDLIRSWFWVKK